MSTRSPLHRFKRVKGFMDGDERSIGSVDVESEAPFPVVRYTPVAVVRSPFRTLDGMPLQSVAAPDVLAQVEVRPELEPGLRDLDGFSHLHLITHLHRGRPGGLEVVPFLDDSVRGIFATRSPRIQTRSVSPWFASSGSTGVCCRSAGWICSTGPRCSISNRTCRRSIPSPLNAPVGWRRPADACMSSEQIDVSMIAE